jgi:hypothetical protein
VADARGCAFVFDRRRRSHFSRYVRHLPPAEAQPRAHQAVEAVAAALTALREIDPDVYAERLRLDDRGRELIADRRARWLEAVGRLEILAATRRGEIAKLSESVIKKGGLVLIRLDEQVGATSEISMAWLEAVPAAYKTAVDDARKIARIVAS